MTADKKKGFCLGALTGAGAAALLLVLALAFTGVWPPAVPAGGSELPSSASAGERELFKLDGAPVMQSELDEGGVYDGIVTPYYKQFLSGNELLAYEAMKTGYEKGAETVTLPFWLAEEQVEKVNEFVKCDWPDIRTSGNLWDVVPLEEDGSGEVRTVLGVRWKSRYSDENNKQAIREARRIVDEMPAFETPYEKAKYLYDYLAQNIAYTVDEGDGLGENNTLKTPYGGLIEKKADCDGFAGTGVLLMQMAGFPCMKVYIGGDDRAMDAGHAWNLVQIEGEWYHFDASSDANLRALFADSGSPYFCSAFGMPDEGIVVNQTLRLYLPQCVDDGIQQKLLDLVVAPPEGEATFDELDRQLAALVGRIAQKLQFGVQNGKPFLAVKIRSREVYYDCTRRFSEGYGEQVLEKAGLYGYYSYSYNDTFQMLYLTYTK